LLVTVNNRRKFEIVIVHDLSCHRIFRSFSREHVSCGDCLEGGCQNCSVPQLYILTCTSSSYVVALGFLCVFRVCLLIVVGSCLCMCITVYFVFSFHTA